jgi:hypothetical protein
MGDAPKESACRAFGVPFDVRPGAHCGEITLENVEGCLYGVRKTSELLWALDAEHAKHPVALHLSKAQSGATIAKAYLGALGVQPRLQVQPDFPKSYLGYAAQGYYGGRVEARIMKTLLQCVYLDFLSMYPTVFALLGLWSNHVIPECLKSKRFRLKRLQRCFRTCASISKPSSTPQSGSGSNSLSSLTRTAPAYRRAPRSLP